MMMSQRRQFCHHILEASDPAFFLNLDASVRITSALSSKSSSFSCCDADSPRFRDQGFEFGVLEHLVPPGKQPSFASITAKFNCPKTGTDRGTCRNMQQKAKMPPPPHPRHRPRSLIFRSPALLFPTHATPPPASSSPINAACCYPTHASPPSCIWSTEPETAPFAPTDRSTKVHSGARPRGD